MSILTRGAVDLYALFEWGLTFELRIQNRYFKAFLEKDLDWFITLDQDVKFILHPNEIYKVRINIQDYIRLDAPF
jgi:hypothetical protein